MTKGEQWLSSETAIGMCGFVWIRGTRERLEGEAGGIPHLAKNERGVGHPALVTGIEAKRACACYSYRRASTGTKLAARNAGNMPLTRPTTPKIIVATMTVLGEINS